MAPCKFKKIIIIYKQTSNLPDNYQTQYIGFMYYWIITFNHICYKT